MNTYDHYMPQFYLKGFKIADLNESIFFYEKSKPVEYRNISSIGGETSYEEDEIKVFFKKKDNDWATFFQAFHDTEDKFAFLHEKEIETIADFLIFQMCRTPVFLNLMNQYSSAFDDANEELKKSRRINIKTLREHGETKREASKKADKSFQFPRKFAKELFDGKYSFDLKDAIDFATELKSKILIRKWQIFDASFSSKFFITSDHPFILRHNGNPIYLNVRQQIIDSEIFIPISANFAVLSTPSTLPYITPTFALNDREVDELNTEMIKTGMANQLYGRTNEPWIKELFDKTPQNREVLWKFVSDDTWR